MIWLFLALGSALFQSISTIIGKRELLKEHSTEFLMVYVFFIAVVSLLLIPFVSFNLSWFTIAFLFLITIIYIEGAIFSTKALKHMNISVVVPLTNLSPLFLLIIAFLFLGETLTGNQLLGILFLVFGAYMIEVDHTSRDLIKPLQNIIHSKYIHYVFLSMILYSITAVAEKYLFNQKLIDPISMLFYMSIFSVFVILFFQLTLIKNFKGVKRAFNVSRIPIFISAVAFLLSAGFYYYAINLTLVSIIVPIKRLSTLVSTIVGGKFFHEDHIFFKSIATIVMLLGIYLLISPML